MNTLHTKTRILVGAAFVLLLFPPAPTTAQQEAPSDWHLDDDANDEDAAGYPIFRVYVQGAPSDEEVKGVLGPDTAHSDVVDEGTVYFTRAQSTGAIVHAVKRLQDLRGVTDVKLILSQRNGIAIDRLASWCQAKLATTREQPKSATA